MTDRQSDSGSPARGPRRIDGRWLLVAAAVVIVGVVAWRSSLGMSLSDDGYYAAATVRLAQGARLFVDEMYLQSLGFLAAIPFAKVWLWLFGTTGVVLALRLFYVALATVAATFVYRVLHRSFGRTASFAGAVAVFIAPAYNLLSISYDTMAALGMVLACVLCYAALRDGKRRYAAIAGAFAAFAAVSYPPFVLAALALLITLAVRGRGRRLVGAMALGAAGVVAAFLVWLLATTSFTELRGAYDFITSIWRGSANEPAQGLRVLTHWQDLVAALSMTYRHVPVVAWFAPAGAISLWATYSVRLPKHARTRGIALALLPVALVIPAIVYWLTFRHPLTSLKTIGGNLLIELVLFAALPMYASLRGARTDARRDLVLISLPAALVGFAVVLLWSSADIFWASGVVGLAPLVVAAVVWWAIEVRSALGSRVEALAVASLLFALLVLLFGYAFKTSSPMHMPVPVASGPYAGMRIGEGRALQVAAIERISHEWIGPTTTVTSVGLPGAYLLTGGVPLTNVTWLDPGSFDQSTVDYLDRAGRWPDVVVVDLWRLSDPEQYEGSVFLAAVRSNYTFVESSQVASMAVFVSRGLKPVNP